MRPARLPPWVVLHVPHDATAIPDDVRGQFLLDDGELSEELRRMTDHFTDTLFSTCPGDAVVVRSPVSRLVVDVERFADDAQEPMAARGMGAVYQVTSSLAPLRRPLTDDERSALMQAWYHPHHRRLEDAVSTAVDRYRRCLVLDCHSFPSTALPYELAGKESPRPDICIGTDPFHTSEVLARAFVDAFRSEGWNVAVNRPFSGAMVPASRYGRDRQVEAVMVEVSRRLYLEESSAKPRPDFDDVAARIGACCARAIGDATAPPR